MGRYAGWLALESGLAGGADVILIPEIPYDIQEVGNKIMERKKNGKHFSIVVVSEGAKPIGGNMVVKKVVSDSPDPIRLGGIGNVLADEIEKLTGIDTRVTVLGHLQRGGRPSPYDRLLSTRYGVEAVELVMKEEYGKMVCLKGNNIESISIEDAVGILKVVTPDNEMLRIGRSIGIEFGD